MIAGTATLAIEGHALHRGACMLLRCRLHSKPSGRRKGSVAAAPLFCVSGIRGAISVTPTLRWDASDFRRRGEPRRTPSSDVSHASSVRGMSTGRSRKFLVGDAELGAQV